MKERNHSKWLGHSTFTLTLDVYGDYIPEEGWRRTQHAARAARARSTGCERGAIACAAGELGLRIGGISGVPIEGAWALIDVPGRTNRRVENVGMLFWSNYRVEPSGRHILG